VLFHIENLHYLITRKAWLEFAVIISAYVRCVAAQHTTRPHVATRHDPLQRVARSHRAHPANDALWVATWCAAVRRSFFGTFTPIIGFGPAWVLYFTTRVLESHW
jgi:hypothetical protein